MANIRKFINFNEIKGCSQFNDLILNSSAIVRIFSAEEYSSYTKSKMSVIIIEMYCDTGLENLTLPFPTPEDRDEALKVLWEYLKQ